jgi:WhiB family redox-sensing transcriptional regulator
VNPAHQIQHQQFGRCIAGGCLARLIDMNVLADAGPSPLAGVVTPNDLRPARRTEFRIDEHVRRRRRDVHHSARGLSVGLPCQQHNPDLWFSHLPADLDFAKALCAECPVQRACLLGALERGEYTGVWGGQIVENGQILTHKRGPGRPRKDSTAPRRYLVPAGGPPSV